MSDTENGVSSTTPTKNPVETKTKMASFAAFVVSTIALSWLSSLDTDMIKSLPDWLETPAYSALAALIVFATAFNTKHKPGSLSLSALRAAARSRNL